MAGFEECSGEAQPLGHADAGDEDRLGAKEWRSTDLLPSTTVRREGPERIAEEQDHAGDGEEEQTEEDESEILEEVEMAGGGAVEHGSSNAESELFMTNGGNGGR